MSFENIMRTILPDITGPDGFIYRSYINDAISLNPPTPSFYRRSDYNDTYNRSNKIHGGVDIYYYILQGETANSIGSNKYPNSRVWDARKIVSY